MQFNHVLLQVNLNHINMTNCNQKEYAIRCLRRHIILFFFKLKKLLNDPLYRYREKITLEHVFIQKQPLEWKL